jgi:hypothetical protein
LATDNIKHRVQEVLTEAVREEVGLSPEVYEAMESVLVECCSAILNDVLQENEEIMAMNYDIMLDQIFDDFTRGLTQFQKERMRRVSDELHLDPADPFEDYRMKLGNLVDDMFPRKHAPSNLPDEFFEHTERRTNYTTDPDVAAAVEVSKWIGRGFNDRGGKNGE